MIIVTPYLVRPVSGQMALPTDGYRAPTDPQEILEGKTFTGVSGTPVAVAPTPGIARRPRQRRRRPGSSCDRLVQEGH